MDENGHAQNRLIIDISATFVYLNTHKHTCINNFSGKGIVGYNKSEGIYESRNLRLFVMFTCLNRQNMFFLCRVTYIIAVPELTLNNFIFLLPGFLFVEKLYLLRSYNKICHFFLLEYYEWHFKILLVANKFIYVGMFLYTAQYVSYSYRYEE